MSNNTRVKISIVLKFAIFFFMATALGYSFFANDADSFMGTRNILIKYFTIQSNIWIGLTALVLAFIQISRLKSEKYELPRVALIIQQVFTVSITLTGFVFCFVLLPAALMTEPASKEYLLDWTQIFLHVIVPVLAIVDLLGFTRAFKYNFKAFDFLWSAIPPLYYLGFSRIGYVLKWDFGYGPEEPYPYFFLNYDSPAGFFGFSKEMPYFMGVFWWIIAIVIFVFGISKLYTFIVNKYSIKLREKLL